MSQLSERDLIRHYGHMKPGSANGPLDIAPWQDGYTSNASHDERVILDELTTRLSRVLSTVDSVLAKRTSSSNGTDVTVVSHLRTIDSLTPEVKLLHDNYDLTLHKLRCQAFLYNAPRAQITHLPDDVLALILEAASEPLRHTSVYSPYLPGGDGHTNRHRPRQITLAAVCHKWRRLAHRTATLWDRIVISPKLPAEAHDEWCKRSGSTPLDVAIVLDSCTSDARRAEVDFLNLVSPRLRSIKLVAHRLALYHLASEWTAPAPNLREYSVQYDDHCYCRDLVTPPAAEGTYIRAPSEFPLLRKLEINLLRLPWRTLPDYDGTLSSTLHELSLTFNPWPALDGDLGAVLRLLQGVPTLRRLSMKDVNICSHPTAGACTTREMWEPVVLPELRSLYVTTYHGNEACFGWLRLLDAPKLASVNINQSEKWQRVLPGADKV